jgi:hypothetical protein
VLSVAATLIATVMPIITSVVASIAAMLGPAVVVSFVVVLLTALLMALFPTHLHMPGFVVAVVIGVAQIHCVVIPPATMVIHLYKLHRVGAGSVVATVLRPILHMVGWRVDIHHRCTHHHRAHEIWPYTPREMAPPTVTLT